MLFYWTNPLSALILTFQRDIYVSFIWYTTILTRQRDSYVPLDSLAYGLGQA